MTKIVFIFDAFNHLERVGELFSLHSFTELPLIYHYIFYQIFLNLLGYVLNRVLNLVMY